MAASIRKNLIFFIFNHASNKNVHVCISPFSLSLPPHFFSTQTLDINPTVYEILVHKHDFPCEFSSRITSELGCVKNPERANSMLAFLKSNGFSNAHLQKILKYRPTFLFSRLEGNIKPKIKSFEDEGFSSADISKTISSCPRILQSSMNNTIIPSLSLLKGFLGSNDAVIRVVRNLPWLLNWNLQKTLVPNVEFLKSCGISMDQIRILFQHYPRAFCCKPQVMSSYVEKAEKMGLTAASKAFIYGIIIFSSLSNKAWELKLQAFRDMGFSDSDILSMFRKQPRVFSVSAEKMKKITEGLVVTGKFDISSIVHHPVSLMFSFEKRYKPRLRILRILETRSLIETWPPLHVIYNKSDAEFYERFVRPYLSKIVDVYMEEMKD